MISVQLDRPSTPPFSNSRPDVSLVSSSFSATVSTSAAPAIVAPKPFRPNASDHLALPSESRATHSHSHSTPSPPPSDPNVLHSRSLAQGVSVPSIPDVSSEIFVDDEGLSSVEKIYLFCRSTTKIHRIFISRSLHTFLPGVSALEAVEYVLPLLNSLAVDDEDAVKEALASSLVDIMWWFFENCRLIEDEPPEDQSDPPLLPVQTFTPILGSLLIDHSPTVGTPARFAVVQILNRLHSADERCEDTPPFGSKERKMLEQEIVHQVIIGMGRLDVSEENFPSPISMAELTPMFSSTVSPSSSTDNNTLTLSPLLSSDSRPLSPPTLQLEATDSMTETHATQVTPPALSSFPSSDFPPEPTSPPSSDRSSQVSFAARSPPPKDDYSDNETRSCPHPTWEATVGETTSKLINYENQDCSIGEGRECQDIQDEANEQAAIGRLSSMSLIAAVTANAKLPEDTVRAFADEVAYIGGDPLSLVRREASFAVGALAKVVPVEVVLVSLLPLFENLVQDAVWQVRHSAIFALPGILTRLSPQHRRTLALGVLIPLSRDVVPTIRSGVLEVLGEVIYAFHEDNGGVPPELVSIFVGRDQGPEWCQHAYSTDHRESSPSTPKAKTPSSALSSVFESDDDSPEESEGGQPGQAKPTRVVITTPCDFILDPTRSIITSFNYPAVALSLGPRRWGEVREHYLTLTRDKNMCVRRTIAASLGEMARILGSELALRDLVDVWQDIVHDAEDGETRLKALENVCLFVGVLEKPARGSIVMVLGELWEKWLTGWRERECLTQALPALAVLAEGQGEVVRALMGKALVDKMAAVRDAAVEALNPLFRAFESWPHHAEALRDDLRSLASMDCCRRRATYVACCRALAEGEQGKMEVASEEFWKHIFTLSQDRVVDVRIGVARLLSIVCSKFYPHPSTRSPRLIEIIRRLSQDPSRDVCEFVAFLVPGEASQLRQNLMTPVTQPMIFATFSRPPPKVPSVVVKVDIQDLASGVDDSLMEDQSQGGSPTVPKREGDHLMIHDKETEEGRQSDSNAVDDTFKPPLLRTND